MAVPYGTTKELNYTIKRGQTVRIQLPGFLEDEPHDLTGVRWMATVPSGALPRGITVSLVQSGKGKYVYLSGSTVAPEPMFLPVIVARSSSTFNGKPRPVTWLLTLRLEGEIPASTPPAGSISPTPTSPSTPSPPVPTEPPVQPTLTTYSWDAAQELAESGKRIRMIGWADRWLSYDGNWWMAVINPITKVEIERHVVRMQPESDVSWFTGSWTTDS